MNFQNFKKNASNNWVFFFYCVLKQKLLKFGFFFFRKLYLGDLHFQIFFFLHIAFPKQVIAIYYNIAIGAFHVCFHARTTPFTFTLRLLRFSKKLAKQRFKKTKSMFIG